MTPPDCGHVGVDRTETDHAGLRQRAAVASVAVSTICDSIDFVHQTLVLDEPVTAA
jgi:hypothetical protein